MSSKHYVVILHLDGGERGAVIQEAESMGDAVEHAVRDAYEGPGLSTEAEFPEGESTIDRIVQHWREDGSMEKISLPPVYIDFVFESDAAMRDVTNDYFLGGA